MCVDMYVSCRCLVPTSPCDIVRHNGLAGHNVSIRSSPATYPVNQPTHTRFHGIPFQRGAESDATPFTMIPAVGSRGLRLVSPSQFLSALERHISDQILAKPPAMISGQASRSGSIGQTPSMASGCYRSQDSNLCPTTAFLATLDQQNFARHFLTLRTDLSCVTSRLVANIYFLCKAKSHSM